MKEYTKILNELKRVDENLFCYTSMSGHLCYRTHGDLNYYFLLCHKFDLKPKMDSDFSYHADKQNYGLEYIEGDIILVKLWRESDEK